MRNDLVRFEVCTRSLVLAVSLCTQFPQFIVVMLPGKCDTSYNLGVFSEQHFFLPFFYCEITGLSLAYGPLCLTSFPLDGPLLMLSNPKNDTPP